MATPIVLNVQKLSMTNVELRTEKLKSASTLRAPNTFIDPEGKKIVIPANSNVIDYIEANANADNGFKRDKRAKDYVGQFEKEFAPHTDFKTKVRQSAKGYQWDSFEISVTPEISPEDWEIIKEVAVEVFRGTSAHDDYVLDPDGEVIPFPGMNGKRAMFVSEEHDNTGTRHIHMTVNRFAFDMQNKEIATGIDLSKKGNLSKGFSDFRNKLVERNVNFSMAVTGSIGKDLSNNEVDLMAQEATNDQLLEAGGQGRLPSRQVTVEVPLGNGETTYMAAPLSANEETLQRRQGLVHSELEHLNKEIVRMQEQAKAKALEATVIQQAIAAVAGHTALVSRLEDAETRLTQAAEDYQTLQSVADTVTQERDQAEEARQALHGAMVGIGTNLAEQGPALGVDDAQVQELQRGNLEAIGTLVGTLGTKVSGLNEALDSFPDDLADVAKQMRDDPFTGLNALLDELQKTRQSNATLTGERDGLTNQLAAATTLNTELQGKLTTMESDLENIKAQMAQKEAEFERKTTEQADLVRAAQADVARAEGKVSAKQDQLVEEQAKVEKLTRTKEALLSVMTSENAGQAWEQSKDYFKDDAFANRAMGAFLRTGSELEQAQQRIASMQAELVDLGQVRENLAAAQATVEETLVLVNDAGVADIRTLVQEHKKLVAANETLQQQVSDLAEAAEKAQEATQKAQKAQKAQPAQGGTLAVEPGLEAALEMLRSHPELVGLLEEARSSDAMRDALLEIAREQTGMQPAQGETDQSTDYTRGLTDDNGIDGPKKDDPDQGNNR